MFEIEWTREELKENYHIEMWSEPKIKDFRKVLLTWYDSQEADHNFPWRVTNDPYKIWISEIMLQQTRTDTVIPYFERFMEAFPDVHTLADAPEDKVLKLWEGLGYYSRARNIKEAARQIVLQHGGVFPNEPKEIEKLKGIGPYTTGAISSMAFNLPTPAIDGNLMRVLSRLFEIDLDIGVAKNRKVFQTVARYLIDSDRPGDWNQAMMDLGRTICTPKNYFPEQSPVKEFNASYINETWQEYPVKKPKSKPKPVTYIALILKNAKGEYYMEQRPETGLLANMWTFPLIQVEDIITDGTWKPFKPVILEAIDDNEKSFIVDYVKEQYGLEIQLNDQTSGVVDHVFSHLKWSISVFEGIVTQEVEERLLDTNHAWMSEDNFEEYVFPTVQKKLWESYNKLTLF
ncbi:MAG TPA: A/G-specific adenine glycosylase [Atopostipes sp.]|nr:A/G-specific adenine glycosylase [Atopostipes sp.]